jgi:hypothetical protein
MLGRRAMIWSLVTAHLWGTVLVAAAWRGRCTEVCGGMFASVCFMIFTTLGVLVGGKAWKEFAPLRWGGTHQGGRNVQLSEDVSDTPDDRADDPDRGTGRPGRVARSDD